MQTGLRILARIIRPRPPEEAGVRARCGSPAEPEGGRVSNLRIHSASKRQDASPTLAR